MPRFFIRDGNVPGHRIPAAEFRKSGVNAQSSVLSEAQAITNRLKLVATQAPVLASPPVITSAVHLDVDVTNSSTWTYQIVASGSPTSYGLTGTWPPGTTVSPTGLVTVNYALTGGNTYNFQGVSATNAAGTTTQALVIQTWQKPSSMSFATGIYQGGAWAGGMPTSGAMGLPQTVVVAGLPAGIGYTWAGIGSGGYSVTLNGTTNVAKGQYNFTVTATNPAGVTVGNCQLYVV